MMYTDLENTSNDVFTMRTAERKGEGKLWALHRLYWESFR